MQRCRRWQALCVVHARHAIDVAHCRVRQYSGGHLPPWRASSGLLSDCLCAASALATAAAALWAAEQRGVCCRTLMRYVVCSMAATATANGSGVPPPGTTSLATRLPLLRAAPTSLHAARRTHHAIPSCGRRAAPPAASPLPHMATTLVLSLWPAAVLESTWRAALPLRHLPWIAAVQQRSSCRVSRCLAGGLRHHTQRPATQCQDGLTAALLCTDYRYGAWLHGCRRTTPADMMRAAGGGAASARRDAVSKAAQPRLHSHSTSTLLHASDASARGMTPPPATPGPLFVIQYTNSKHKADRKSVV